MATFIPTFARLMYDVHWDTHLIFESIEDTNINDKQIWLTIENTGHIDIITHVHIDIHITIYIGIKFQTSGQKLKVLLA